MSTGQHVIHLHPDDSVAVAVRPLSPGDVLRIGNVELTVREPIQPGHKVALTRIPAGHVVRKYGVPIGIATRPIPDPPPVPTPRRELTFEGFVRPDGEVGTRNEIWILPTVGCVNRVACALARHARRRGIPETVEGVHAFEHPYGCSQLGEDLLHTQKLLAALAHHPNAGGVLIVGLGCENNHIRAFRKVLGESDPDRVVFLACQEVNDEMATGGQMLERLITRAATFHRQSLPVSYLKVGLKCGGSDGFSGITANPLIGAVTDEIVAQGGTALLTEVPEMFGAEEILSARCADRNVFDKFVRLIEDFKSYYTRHGQPVHENPSPGNQEGGITTLEEKSLGCVLKGGRSPIVDVLEYGEPASRPGLNLVAAPGNDMISVTALAAAGAQIILFSTGRGTPLGGPVPTLKIASTHALAEQKPRWIDFDAGPLLEGVPMMELADQLMEQVIQIASGGAYTQNERNDFREIAIFKSGVIL